jgi:hypothetical protein
MFGIWFILAITVVIATYFILRRLFNEDIAYMGVSVVPLGSLLLAILFGAFFGRVLGDWGIAELIFALMTTSPILGLIGLLMVVKAFRQHKYRIAMVGATVLAYLPLIILVFPRGK